MRSRALYDLPDWYELLHEAETEAQLEAVLALARRHGAPAGAWLEPACGTGRFLEALARRGVASVGYDSNPRMTAFARRRLRPWKGLAEAVPGDMRTFSRRGPFAAALSLDGSFRHLPSDEDALRHLRLTAASLAPGGLYLLGLDLCDYAAAEDDEETWEASRGGRRVSQVQLCLAPGRRERRERVLNFLTLEEGGRRHVSQSSYDLRSYDAGQWRRLLARSPFAQKGPAAPEGAAGAFVFVLAKPSGR